MTTPHQLLLSLHEALNTHDLTRLQSLFATHFRGQDCAQPGMVCGPEGVRETVQTYIQAFPNLHLQLIDVQIGDQGVAAFWTAQGTHRGPWKNIPPTGQAVSIQGMWMLHIEKGRITRARSVWDVAGLLRTIGLLPDL